MATKISLKLFVNSNTPSSQRAILNLHRICQEESSFRDHYRLQIIDVSERPMAAEAECIIATPTLIKELPLFKRKIIGDLSDREKVLTGLNLDELKSSTSNLPD